MADSLADLLFRVSVDSSPAQAEMAQLRQAVLGALAEMVAGSKAANTAILYDWAGRPIQKIGDDFEAMGQAAERATQRMGSGARVSRLAIRGLGEETGVHMPRFVASWLSSLGPVSGIMAAAFAPIAVLGLVEVLSRIPGAIQKGVDWLHGWTAASKKAFEESTKQALAWEVAQIGIRARLRAVQLIGLEGAEREHVALQINKQDLDDVKVKLDILEKKQKELRETAGIPPGQTPEQMAAVEFGAPLMVGVKEVQTVPPALKPPTGATNAVIEQAKAHLKELAGSIKELTDKIADLNIRGKELEAQLAADEGVNKATEDFRGLSRILEEVRGKIAAATSEEEKAAQEVQHLREQIAERQAELKKKRDAGKLEPGEWERETAAMRTARALLPGLEKQLQDAIAEKRKEAAEQAAAELAKRLAAEGAQTLAEKIKAWDAEMNALAAKYGKEKQLTAENIYMLGALRQAGEEKIRRERAAEDARETSELEGRIEREGETSLEAQTRGWNREMEELRRSLAQKQDLTARHWYMIQVLQAAGVEKLKRDAAVAYATQMAGLGEHLKSIERENETAAERIADEYQADVARYSAAEEAKVHKKGESELQMMEIAAKYYAIKVALFQREQTDLQRLQNSLGWQGVFGSGFAAMIRGNEQLSKEWASSTDQSHMLVRVSMETLKEQSQEAFGHMAEGMGGAIAQSLVYSKSIGAAMEAALKSTLASIAARDIVLAIDALGWGFYDLAMEDYPAAAAAFQAAAIFGSIGAAAAVIGRAIPGGAGAGGTGAGTGAPGVGERGSQTSAMERNAAAGAVGAPPGAGGPHVTVNVWGHVVGTSGIAEFASLLNDAVLNKDVVLTATNTKTGVQVTR